MRGEESQRVQTRDLNDVQYNTVGTRFQFNLCTLFSLSELDSPLSVHLNCSVLSTTIREIHHTLCFTIQRRDSLS